MLFNKTNTIRSVLSLESFVKCNIQLAAPLFKYAFSRKWMHIFICTYILVLTLAFFSALTPSQELNCSWKQFTQQHKGNIANFRESFARPTGLAVGRESTHVPSLLKVQPCFLSHRTGSWYKLTFSIPRCSFCLVATPLT